MGSAERRASTDDLLARIDDIVGGHEHQHSREAISAVNLDDLDDDITNARDRAIALGSFVGDTMTLRTSDVCPRPYLSPAIEMGLRRAAAQMVRDLVLLGEALARIHGSSVAMVNVHLSPRFREFVRLAVEACRPVPVPAKAAHRRRYGRG